jgi:hypothetical protein
MPDEAHTGRDPNGPATYRLTIEGHMGHRWEGWFDGMTITTDGSGNTLLTGPVADQAALFGLLRKVRDLGKPLLSVSRIDIE